MKTEIMIAVLALLCIGSLAAVFVLWAKLDEQKKATEEERDRRWDEISRAVDLEKQLDCAASAYEGVTGMYRTMSAYSDIVKQDRNALQDRLSSLLCPHNDHVWRDGVCVKCGRLK
jgi:hypothetical protein